MATRTERATLLTYEEVAETLRMHPQTLRQWVSQKKFPHLKIGANVRFTQAMIDQYIKSTLVDPTCVISHSSQKDSQDCLKEEEDA
ncbi:helix-turn-helix domain-containing protein [Sphaerochaeta globosa]|uniref:DNA binding domain protein, excisionase family n=1 Tax=Sphaerochaeta globosa (strain ATCC BAA-1886 / DSM 22777 / Buddy) TaxID=158189 RepID=F0RRD0_SPHGB|nr:helix-turn-helix domain-containing protein [Sphaerochaeta globosa]ADY14153.1 DNA binding domain protein, excisionase family [Sphaerochaeta globosa str. Buddy]